MVLDMPVVIDWLGVIWLTTFYRNGKEQPESVMAIGGKYAFPDDAMELLIPWPQCMIPRILPWSGNTLNWYRTGNWKRPHGSHTLVKNGTLVLDRTDEVVPEKQGLKLFLFKKNIGWWSDLHIIEFPLIVLKDTPQKLMPYWYWQGCSSCCADGQLYAFRHRREKVSWDDAKQSFQTARLTNWLTWIPQWLDFAEILKSIKWYPRFLKI